VSDSTFVGGASFHAQKLQPVASCAASLFRSDLIDITVLVGLSSIRNAGDLS
jgi:hypothetical protein